MAFPGWATDYAPDYNVEVSDNGSSWTVVASCYGNGSPETATFSPQTTQYVEVVLTTPDPSSWWSISQFLVFAAPGTSTGVGWTSTGQWFRYTVNVASAGTYNIALRLSSPRPGPGHQPGLGSDVLRSGHGGPWLGR